MIQQTFFGGGVHGVHGVHGVQALKVATWGFVETRFSSLIFPETDSRQDFFQKHTSSCVFRDLLIFVFHVREFKLCADMYPMYPMYPTCTPPQLKLTAGEAQP